MIKVEIIRGKQIESLHSIKCLVINSKNKIIYTTNNDNDLVFPRSAIKIFQAIPFILSGASDYFNTNEKQIALSSSSHFGEIRHINYLKDWLKKIKISENYLKCGIHNPSNQASANKLLLKGIKPTPIYNNCSGKHLGMISTAIYKDYNIDNYTNFDHPIQKSILLILENFTEYKIKKINKSIDGCSAPQYSFPIESLALAMSKVSCYSQLQFDISISLNKLLYSIIKNPFYIGGTNRFDSELINITKGRIFCKGGAEGVLLFSDFKKKYGGILKVEDGNFRAIPSATIALLKKIGSINKFEEKKLVKWSSEKLYNHANTYVGLIRSKKL